MTEIESLKYLLSNFEPLYKIWQFGTASTSALSRLQEIQIRKILPLFYEKKLLHTHLHICAKKQLKSKLKIVT